MTALPARILVDRPPTAMAPRRIAAPVDLIEAARAEGYAAGEAEARQRWAGDLHSLQSAMSALQTALAESEAARRSDLCEALRSILAAVSPQLATRMLLDDVAARLAATTSALDAGAVITANEETAALLASSLGGKRSAVEIVIDPSLAFGDVSGRWRGGGVDARIGAALAALDDFLAGRAARPIQKESDHDQSR